MLAIATNTPLRLVTGFVTQGHIYQDQEHTHTSNILDTPKNKSQETTSPGRLHTHLLSSSQITSAPKCCDTHHVPTHAQISLDKPRNTHICPLILANTSNHKTSKYFNATYFNTILIWWKHVHLFQQKHVCFVNCDL